MFELRLPDPLRPIDSVTSDDHPCPDAVIAPGRARRSEQMGTSVKIIEDHYGHITPVKNADCILLGLPGWYPAAPDHLEES
jgi:hypothetical protein